MSENRAMDDDHGVVPDWAAPLDAADFERFMAMVGDALQPLGGTASPEGWAALPAQNLRFGLANLAQTWLQWEPDTRAERLRVHFADALVAVEAPRPTGAELLAGIRPRLWPNDELERIGTPVVSRPVAHDLSAVLCVDLPTAVSTMRPEEAGEMPLDELWQTALGQIDDGLAVETFELVPEVEVITGDSMFVASRMLDLSRFAGPPPPDGTLVAVPNRHLMVVHAIRGPSVRDAMNAMLPTAQSQFIQGPGPISPHLFWWRDGGVVEAQLSELDGEEITLTPTRAFADLLERLG
jgi:hypothetical protein